MPSRPPRLETLTMTPSAPFEHAGQEGQGHGHRREVVDGHGAAHLVQGDPLDRPAEGDPGVVDEHLDGAEIVPDPAGQLGRLLRFGEVGGIRARCGGARHAVGQHLFEPLRSSSHEGHGRSPAGELAGQRRADPRRCPGDDGHSLGAAPRRVVVHRVAFLSVGASGPVMNCCR